ncbi:MAG: methionyl-tRNA formyltransferase [Gammaproteobacteria bacterium]|nr:methionyl-tRNA formyltransferase [Gammaproteobacteria bacterium]
MKVDIITEKSSWMIHYIEHLVDMLQEQGFDTRVCFDVDQLTNGEILLILSCGQLLKPKHLSLHKHNLVVHASALPQGRGWSPVTWQILDGLNCIPITLFECAKGVDSGDIYLVDQIRLLGHELVHEIREKQAHKTIELCLKFIRNYKSGGVTGIKQHGEPTYFPKRSAEDSQLDIDKTIADQFNLLRIADNERYPAYFLYKNRKYIIKIECCAA